MFVEGTWDVLLANYRPNLEILSKGMNRATILNVVITLCLEEKGRSRPDNRVCMHENLFFRNRYDVNRDK
jgi:hypothetical protein